MSKTLRRWVDDNKKSIEKKGAILVVVVLKASDLQWQELLGLYMKRAYVSDTVVVF